MSREEDSVLKRDLRSPLLILAVLCCLGAVVFAVPGVALLFDRELTARYLLFLSLDYIDESAQMSWLIVRWLINILALLVPALIALGLVLTVVATFFCGENGFPVWGLKYFSRLACIIRWILYAVAVVLGLVFLFRVAVYMIVNGSQNGGVLFIFAMLLPELVFAAVVAIILFFAVRGMKCAELTADNVRLNVLSGKCESYGLKSGTPWLTAMLGVAAIVLLVVNKEEKAAVLCFAMAALADFLLTAWLLWYRRRNGKRALKKFRSGNDLFA